MPHKYHHPHQDRTCDPTALSNGQWTSIFGRLGTRRLGYQGTPPLIAVACTSHGNALNKGAHGGPGTEVQPAVLCEGRHIYQGPQQIPSADCDTFGLTVIRWG
jgi:hypothetical protein